MSSENDKPAVDPLDDGVLDELSHRGEAIYRERLQSLVEPEHNGEYIAIHLDTGDYVLGRSSPDAMRQMRRVHPAGLMAIRQVGPDQMDQLGYRILSRVGKILPK